MIVPPDDLPHFRPLSAKVEALAGFGIPASEIACVLDVEKADLARDYAKELAGGAIKANARVAESLFRKATGDGRESVTAAIFWLKTRARWKESTPQPIEQVSAHEAITFQVVYEAPPGEVP